MVLLAENGGPQKTRHSLNSVVVLGGDWGTVIPNVCLREYATRGNVDINFPQMFG